MRRIAILCLLFLSISISRSFAQVNVGESSKLSGLVYSDYYWMASSHDESLEGSNGFWIRRIYFTYDHKVNESFSSRLRLEMNGEGDFTTSARMTPVVKDAWLKWENERHQILAGISPTPTFELVRDTWGYRAVEETPLNLQNFGSSRDFGIAAKGTIGEDEKLGYHVMVGNGHGHNGAEIDKGKKLMLSISYQLTDQWVVEVYGDRNSLSGDQSWTTLQGFAGYRTEDLSFGALYARQHRSRPAPLGDLNLDIASVFARAAFTASTTGFFRVDHMFDPNPAGSNISYIPFSDDAESTLLIGGVDIAIDSGIHLIPNIEAVIYGETPLGNTPKSDLIPRLTLFYQF